LNGVLSSLNLENPRDLIPWVYQNTSWDRVASLYPIAASHALLGDRVANQIIEHAVEELCETISVVVHDLKFNDNSFDLVFSGGILTHDNSLVASKLLEMLKNKFQKVNVTLPQVSAQVAAALLARTLIEKKN